jgi:hypothetical protein
MKNLNPIADTPFCILIMIFLSACTKKTQEFIRGIGIYPGDVNEAFSPELVIESKTYRNLALHRSAFHSSSIVHGLENKFGSG